MLPERTFILRLTFADMGTDPFALDVVLANGTTIHYTDIIGGTVLLIKKEQEVPISRVVVVGSPVEYIGIASLTTYDHHGFPDESKKYNLKTSILSILHWLVHFCDQRQSHFIQ